MKSYVEKALVENKYILDLQYVGGTERNVFEILMGSTIVRYQIPTKQSLNCTWNLIFYLDNGDSVKFSALCTNIGGWQEMGSLRIELAKLTIDSEKIANGFLRTEIKRFQISSLSFIEYSDEIVSAKCGFILANDVGEEIIIATSPAPGAVTVQSFFSDKEFNPEIKLSDCKIQSMGSPISPSVSTSRAKT